MKTTQNRPTFYLDDDENKPIRAGGVLFYFFDETDLTYYLLLIYSREKYEDFGGCTDCEDKSIQDTVARETAEESNYIFSKKFVLDKIQDQKPVYIKHCKYVLYFVELTEKYDSNVFGTREICDGFDRTVEWISFDTYDNKEFLQKVNSRMNNWIVHKHIKKILK
jgi:hypothetical protein